MNDLKQHPVLKKYLEWNAFGRTLGMDFEIPAAGKVVYKMTIQPMHLATPVAAHGGAVAALLDAALGVACLSKVCEDGKIVSTVSINVQFMLPAFLNDQLTVFAEVTKAGKRLLFVEGKVSNQKNEMIASATATMNAYPIHKIS